MLHLLRVIFCTRRIGKRPIPRETSPSRTAHRMADSNQFYIAKSPADLTVPAGQEKKPPRRTHYVSLLPPKGALFTLGAAQR